MVNVILDLSGEVCPVPIIKVRRTIDKMEKDEVLEVTITDEDSKTNIIMAAKELGMKITKIEKDKDGKWHMHIRKK
jgi:TusA-related sulfurtransferase